MTRQVRRSIALGHAQETGVIPVQGKKFNLERMMIIARGGVPKMNLGRIFVRPSKSDSREYRKA